MKSLPYAARRFAAVVRAADRAPTTSVDTAARVNLAEGVGLATERPTPATAANRPAAITATATYETRARKVTWTLRAPTPSITHLRGGSEITNRLRSVMLRWFGRIHVGCTVPVGSCKRWSPRVVWQ